MFRLIADNFVLFAEVVFAAGVAWGVVKVRGSSMDKKIKELETEALAMHDQMQDRIRGLESELHAYKADTTDRLARIETKLDILLQSR